MTSTTNNIQIKSLKDIPFREIADAFLNAFSDYGLTLDDKALHDMFTRRGACFEMSAGAFVDNRMVSFIINGTGCFNGLRTAYDTGTGTVKEYRGLGLTDRLFQWCCQYLADAGIEAYLLEVLQDNAPAVKIYRRQGLEAARELRCYTAPNKLLLENIGQTAPDGIEICPASVSELRLYASFMDFNPSWQNSFDSIERAPDAFSCFIAKINNTVAGFGASETAYGDISLLAVDSKMRRHSIGSALLRRLIELNRIDNAKVINVDESCSSLKAFLEKAGFRTSCMQYEMIKQLP